MLPVKSNLRPTVSKFFDESWNSLFDWSKSNYPNLGHGFPSVNISDNTDNYVVEMAAPGRRKEEFNIELQNNLLVIESQKSEGAKTEETNFYRREYSYQSFRRSFSLNHQDLDLENIEASYNDGILKVVIPKLEDAKSKEIRKIDIS